MTNEVSDAIFGDEIELSGMCRDEIRRDRVESSTANENIFHLICFHK